MFSHVHARRGFTLIELLVVMGIILLLAGLLLTGINAVRLHVARNAVRMEIQNMMTALEAYNDEYYAYPPGGKDENGDGDLDDAGDDLGAGTLNEPQDDATNLQLRSVTVRLPKGKAKENWVGPYYEGKVNQVNEEGQYVDHWDTPYRYLADGRVKGWDEGGGNPALRAPSRVSGHTPVIWSLGEDGAQDVGNNNNDDDGDGRVDEQDENGFENDICSWN